MTLIVSSDLFKPLFQGRDLRLIPRTASIGPSITYLTRASWLYAPCTVEAATPVPIGTIHVEVAQMTAPLEATEEERSPPDIRKEFEPILLLRAKPVVAEIVVPRLAVDLQVESTPQVILYNDRRTRDAETKEMLMESRYYRDLVCSGPRALD